MSDLQGQAIRQHCKALRMPTIGGQFARLAEAAEREGLSHVGYLEALLGAEMEERESRAIARLVHDARLPRMKTLDAFEFDRSGVAAAQVRTLAESGYIARAEPILLWARLAREDASRDGTSAWRPVVSAAGSGLPPLRR